MSDEVRSLSETATKMDVFGDANNNVIKNFAIPLGMFTELKTIKQGFEQAGALRSSFGSTGASATQSKAAIYNSMYRRLRRISRTGAIIKQREPDFDNKYRLPRDRMGYQEGLERAKAMLADVNADKQKFLDYLLKQSVIDGLTADIAAFEAALNTQVDARMSGVGETANLDSLVERFMEIHGPLNQMMKNLFADDPEKLAEWRTAAHIERKKSGTTNNNPTPDNPPTP